MRTVSLDLDEDLVGILSELQQPIDKAAIELNLRGHKPAARRPRTRRGGFKTKFPGGRPIPDSLSIDFNRNPMWYRSFTKTVSRAICQQTAACSDIQAYSDSLVDLLHDSVV